MSSLSQLHSITNGLLQLEKHELGGAFRAADELFRFLVHTIKIETSDAGGSPQTMLQSGKALNSEEAARCIKDFLRTKRFIDGIAAAVKDRQQQFPGKPIRILYAGTGPFATLLLPLTALLGPGEMKWVLLEAHAPSYDYLQTTITTFGLEGYVESMHRVDATSWQIPAGMHFDILVSETMQCALIKEPQVAIWMNLLPQLNEDCIIIPQQVRLSIAWIEMGKRVRIKSGELTGDVQAVFPIATVFDLSREMILCNREKYFPPVKITVMPHPSADLHILTDIIIYGDHVLKIDDCGLTLPFPIRNLPPIMESTELSCTYITGHKPHLAIANEQ